MFEHAVESGGPLDMWLKLSSVLFGAGIVIAILIFTFILAGLVRDRRWMAACTLGSCSAALVGLMFAVWNI